MSLINSPTTVATVASVISSKLWGLRTESWIQKRHEGVRMYSREERMKAIESYIKHINLFFMGFGIPPFSLILVISVDHAIGPLFPISIAQDGQSLFLMSVTVTVEWWITLPPSLHRSRSADILLRNLQRHLPRLDQAQLSRLSYYVRLPARDIDLGRARFRAQVLPVNLSCNRALLAGDSLPCFTTRFES